LVDFSAAALTCMARTELKIGDETPGFGCELPGTGPGMTVSPWPMATYSVRPRIDIALGPEASPPAALVPWGNPSSRVLRVPFGLTIEMRPDRGTFVVPVSETTRLPWFVIALPIGPRNPDVSTVQSAAFTDETASNPALPSTATQAALKLRE
jgi:hypothetical protein